MSATVIIDGVPGPAREGDDLLSVCLSRGAEVPFFCWHGALGSVGACRLCAVRVHQDEDDEAGAVVMACMTGAADGQRVVVNDPEAAHFRAGVVEWVMANHPHDCAVCEEAGCCHLQDMTLATGHHRRRFQFNKRTHRNQWLGPLLTHEMNRCIACYRCTRFYRHYAGGRDLDVFGMGGDVYFGRYEDGVLESPFAGNLAEVCPVGVFNDRGWSRDYARKWDMRASPSVCPHCAVGCNVFLNERDGRLRRVGNRYHSAVNGYFLCDRGRFGAAFVHAGTRLRAPLVDGEAVSEEAATAALAFALSRPVVAVGSPRASLEGNFALRRLAGADRFFAGIAEQEAADMHRLLSDLAARGDRIAAPRETEKADAVLVLGVDVTGAAPRLALSLRQASRNAALRLAEEKGVPAFRETAVNIAGEGRRSPIVIATAMPDALDDIATQTVRAGPDAVADFGFAVTDALLKREAPDAAREAANALSAAEAPLVVAGAGFGAGRALEAAGAVLDALGPNARLAPVAPEANSVGLALLSGDGLEAAAERLEAEAGATLLVLENDLFERASAATVERCLAVAERVVVLDHVATRTVARADIALPVATFAEAAGVFVNAGGRAQRFAAGIPHGPPAAWRVLARAAHLPWRNGGDVLASLAESGDAFRPLEKLCDADRTPAGPPARAPSVFSARTADDAAGRIAEGTPPPDPDTPLVWSMEGARGIDVPPALATGYVTATLTSPMAVHRFQEEVNGPLRGGDPGVRLVPCAPTAAPPPREDDGDGLRLVPLHDPFRGDETARQSPLLAERAPAPRLLLHPDDAARLGLASGDRPLLGGLRSAVPLELDPAVPVGCLAASAGAVLPRGARRIVVEKAP